MQTHIFKLKTTLYSEKNNNTRCSLPCCAGIVVNLVINNEWNWREKNKNSVLGGLFSSQNLSSCNAELVELWSVYRTQLTFTGEKSKYILNMVKTVFLRQPNGVIIMIISQQKKKVKKKFILDLIVILQTD